MKCSNDVSGPYFKQGPLGGWADQYWPKIHLKNLSHYQIDVNEEHDETDPRIMLGFEKKLPSVFTSVSFNKKAEIWGIIPEKDESWILPNRNSLYSSMFTLDSFFTFLLKL